MTWSTGDPDPQRPGQDPHAAGGPSQPAGAGGPDQPGPPDPQGPQGPEDRPGQQQPYPDPGQQTPYEPRPYGQPGQQQPYTEPGQQAPYEPPVHGQAGQQPPYGGGGYTGAAPGAAGGGYGWSGTAPGTAEAGYPGYPAQQRPVNVMAILSLIFAFVFAPLGIAFGYVARSQIRRTGEGGSGLAKWGLILGWVFTVLGILGCAIWIAVIVIASNSSTSY